jgi:DNA-binding MarR family transcriptional regulator
MPSVRPRDDPRRLTAEEAELFDAFYVMRRGFDRALDAQLQRDHGVSMSEIEVLMALVRAPGRRLRVRELVAATGWEKSRISHQVTRLEARGFIDRQACADDHRASYIHLTGHGRRVVVHALPEHTATIRRILFDPLTEEQQAQFLEVSRRMAEAIAHEDRSARPEKPVTNV